MTPDISDAVVVTAKKETERVDMLEELPLSSKKSIYWLLFAQHQSEDNQS